MNLEETSKNMREQSNRHTQFPLFVVQEKLEVVKADGCGDRVIYFNGDSQIEITAEEYDLLEEMQTWSEMDEDDAEVDDALVSAGLESLADFEPYDWRRIDVSDEWTISDRAGFFFTEKACEDHITQNNYHYTEPRSYVISAWRNPEIVATMQMVLKLTGEEIPEWYR